MGSPTITLHPRVKEWSFIDGNYYLFH